MNYFDNMTMQTAFLGVGMLLSLVNAVFAGFMWRMRATFLPRKEAEMSFESVRKENTLRYEAMQATIGAFDIRMRKVETDAAGAAAEIRGTNAAMSRVERLQMLMVEFKYKEAEASGKT